MQTNRAILPIGITEILRQSPLLQMGRRRKRKLTTIHGYATRTQHDISQIANVDNIRGRFADSDEAGNGDGRTAY